MERYYAQQYDIFVGVDPATREFVAVVHEFPSLSWVSSTSRTHAADGLRTLLADTLADLYAEGEQVPVPASVATGLKELSLMT